MGDACNLNGLFNALFSGGCASKPPPDAAVLSPWVTVVFQSSGVEVTVGNKSSPQNDNHAVIKDFEFGHNVGLECRVTIIDEQGSSFVNLMQDLLKDSKCFTPGAFTMKVDFGWAMDSCPPGISVIKNVQSYYMIAHTIDCNFAGGKFLFQVVGRDLGPMIFDHRDENNRGDDQNEMFLTDAITQMLTTGNPSVSSVKFQRYDDDNNIQPITWKDGDPQKGRKAVWRPNSVDKINAALDWLSQNVTINDKTVMPAFNSEVPGGEVIFWEDYRPGCGESRDWDANCLGSYIVNGGNQSSVIEFNPRISWTFAGLTSPGGGMGVGQVMANPNGGKNPGRLGCGTLLRASIPNAGSNNTAVVNPDNFNVNGKNAAQVAQDGHDAQQKGFGLVVKPIEADLVIIGDPTLMRPSFAIKSKNVKIVFLDPFYIDSGGSSCGDWLAAPVCNPVLTNKAWLVNNMVHKIADGKFTTTIGVYLAAPGVDIDIGEPIGGAGSGGWVPPSNC